jgi:PAS domain S-box-containing protein
VDSLFLKRELSTKKEMIDQDIIYSETDENGFITYVSKPFEAISGYTKEELIGKTHAILKHKNTPRGVYEDMWKTLKSSKQWQGELSNTKKDGSSYTINSIMSPIYFREKLIGYSAACIDITELKNKSRELEAKSKLAAMGEMISMIAHQWRQPIASIGMISNNLHLDIMTDELKTDVLEESLQKIDLHIKYLSKTIDIFGNFLAGTKQIEEFMMKESINEAVSAIKNVCIEKNIAINIVNKCEKFKMNTFRDGLIQAMINILTNSNEALIRKNRADAKIDILCYEDLNSVYIKISDNAGGIDEKMLHDIFTPYFSTKEQKNGAGLGLYMTKTIVEETLDGILKIQNIEDGVELAIELPK